MTLIQLGEPCRPGEPEYIRPAYLEEEECSVESGDIGCGCGCRYMCTREWGHEGDHVAHDIHDQMVATWPRRLD